MSDSQNIALECARHLAYFGGQSVVVLDLRNSAHWTDFFVIATGATKTQVGGLERHVEEFLATKSMKPYRGNRVRYPTMLPNPDDEQEFDADDWKLLDCGDFVVHLMSSRAREFYDLEKLWFQAERTEVKAPDAPTAKA